MENVIQARRFESDRFFSRLANHVTILRRVPRAPRQPETELGRPVVAARGRRNYTGNARLFFSDAERSICVRRFASNSRQLQCTMNFCGASIFEYVCWQIFSH